MCIRDRCEGARRDALVVGLLRKSKIYGSCVCEAPQELPAGLLLEGNLPGRHFCDRVVGGAHHLKVHTSDVDGGQLGGVALALRPQRVILVDAGEARDVKHLAWHSRELC